MRGVTLLYTLLACSTAILSDVNVCLDTENDDPLRHEDCNKFYICQFSRPVEYRCYGDLLFNLQTLQCDSPRNVDCEGRYIPPADDVASTDSTALEPSAAVSTEQKTVSRKKRFLPNGCPDTNIHWLLPHETNCSLFYYCVWGDLVLKECPPGTHFNKALQVCDWPQNANCSAGLTTISTPSTPEPTTPESATPEPTTPGPTTPDPITSEPTTPEPTTPEPITPEPTTPKLTTPKPTIPEFLPNGCPVNPHIHWLLPHEADCTMFYYCVWGDLVLRQCPLGTHFNSILQVCDWPQNANCSAGLTTISTPSTPEPTTTESATRDPTKPDPTTPEPTTPGPTSGPITLAPSTPEPTTSESATPEPTTPGPTTPDPITPEPTTSEPTTPEPITPEPTTPKQTTPKPTIPEFLPNGCPVNPHIHWLLPHETDCTMFYYCVWGDLVLRQCAPGTHFNSVLQVCDWPQNANCSAGLTTTSTPSTPEPTTTESATQDPTQPDPTTPEPTTPGPTSGPTTLATSTPESATPEPTTPGPTTPDPITPEPTTPEPTTPKPTTPKPTIPEFLPNGCPVNPHIHWLLPHETDCTMFYYCVWGDLVLRQCAPGTHFNSVLQVCDWPLNANCSVGLTTISTPSTPEPTTTESATQDPTKPDPTTPEPTTPGPTSGPTTLATSTPEPTTPESATPEPTTPGPTTQDPITPESTTPEPTTPKPTTPKPTIPEFLPNGCPVNPHIHWLLPHETDCTMFYYCVWGDLVLRQCAPGTHFNSVLQVCDWPQNANCSAGLTTISTPSTPEPATTESATQDPTKPDPTTPEPTTPGPTSGPTTLATSTPEPTTPESATPEPTTPGPTTPDPITPEPTTSEPTTPKPTTPKPTIPEFLPNGCPLNPHIHWLLPHETDCTMFYYCVWGDLVLRQCAPGTHFNSVLQVCDWPQNANCSAGLTTISTPSTPEPTTTESATRDPTKPDPTTPEPTTPGPTSGPTTLAPSTPEPTTSESATPDPITPEPTTPEHTTPEPTTPEPTTPEPTTLKPTTPNPTKPEFLPNGCPVNSHIHWLLPHETDCTMFYYCVWGDLVLRQCAPGTHFNRNLQVCDWPQDAGCTPTLNKHAMARRALLSL